MLGLTQFVPVLDNTVMNVSITDVVGDLGTTTSKMQPTIATFTLTMAALMPVGAGHGTRLGLRRTFVITNVTYAIGSSTTAFAPGLAARFMGWSRVEGFGAALVEPAIPALAAVNYNDRERAVAYAVLGVIAGAASAAGLRVQRSHSTHPKRLHQQEVLALRLGLGSVLVASLLGLSVPGVGTQPP